MPSRNMPHAVLSDFIMLLVRHYIVVAHTHTCIYEKLYLYQQATETEFQNVCEVR